MTTAKIMIVEDETTVALDISTILARMGYEIAAVVGSGEEAVSSAERERPDVVLMDIGLRGRLDGIEAAGRIREQWGTPVIFLTAFSDDEALGRARETEPFGYLVKPYQIKELRATIEMALYKAEMERRLRDSEAKYRLIAENARDVIWTIDLNGNCTYVSPSVFNAQGFTPEEAASRTLEGLITPDSIGAVQEVWFRELALEAEGGADRDRPMTVEVQARRKDDSTFWAEIVASFLRDNRGRAVGILGVTRDIDERKRAEENRERLETQLRQAQKMEAVGTLAGGIAHDFNNILAAIIGYTELTRLDLPKDSPALRNLEQILKGAARARDLIKQILTFTRQAEQARVPLDLARIAREGLAFLRASLPATVEIRQDLPDGPGMVLADPTQMHQVLINLCTNAAHAMRETGGVLEVSLSRERLGGSLAIGLIDLTPGWYLNLTVRDTGGGIPPEHLERIFDPFFTTKGPGEGTGMGLAVVHGIVRGHGGQVVVDSEPGRGSAFMVYLPLLEGETVGAEEGDVEAVGGDERILMVDDEESLVRIGREMLEHLGYQVRITTSPMEALDLFRSDPSAFDLLLTDQTMPRMTGVELARAAMGIRPDLPVILTTGYSETVSADQARRMGIREFVFKPLALADLARTIRGVLDRNAGARP
ncbi:MAG: response regulator [Proteobacteria bacterium]|nr:response regulator [Pseudomonadota bacterium]